VNSLIHEGSAGLAPVALVERLYEQSVCPLRIGQFIWLVVLVADTTAGVLQTGPAESAGTGKNNDKPIDV
jgi:hypothetical protein